MTDDFAESEQFKADFAATGEIEFDEIDDTDAAFEMELLAARIRAARDLRGRSAISSSCDALHVLSAHPQTKILRPASFEDLTCRISTP